MVLPIPRREGGAYAFHQTFYGTAERVYHQVRKGKNKKRGRGHKLFLLEKADHRCVSMPTTTMDANFIFNEVTKTFQAVSIQGQVTYRIRDFQKDILKPRFFNHPVTRDYLSEDPGKLSQRIINAVQMLTREQVQNFPWRRPWEAPRPWREPSWRRSGRTSV